jgi:hypothetical protein
MDLGVRTLDFGDYPTHWREKTPQGQDSHSVRAGEATQNQDMGQEAPPVLAAASGARPHFPLQM